VFSSVDPAIHFFPSFGLGGSTYLDKSSYI
jgi:hypothetical protein